MAQGTPPLIQLKSLSRIYRSEEIETAALSEIEISIDHGEFVAVMGPSGCGKSTLLNILGMLDSPTSGEYLFDGRDIAGYSEVQLTRLRKENVGVIFQSFNLIDGLTVLDNIELPLLYQKVPAKTRRAAVTEIMQKVGISHRARHWPHQLSGGQQQRVAVARAVVGGSRIILADEPAGNLDSANGKEVMTMLEKLNGEGTTVVMVTHDPMHADYAHRTINLFDGRLVN